MTFGLGRLNRNCLTQHLCHHQQRILCNRRRDMWCVKILSVQKNKHCVDTLLNLMYSYVCINDLQNCYGIFDG